MSSASMSPPTSPHASLIPTTPPRLSSQRISLPTPPLSFSAHRARTLLPTSSPADSERVPLFVKSHGRSVSFDKEIKGDGGTQSLPTSGGSSGATGPSPRQFYRIPQRSPAHPSINEDEFSESSPTSRDDALLSNHSPVFRKSPPRALSLPSSQGVNENGPATAPALDKSGRPLSIDMSLARFGTRRSTSGSIWSAGFVPSASSGWITPGLGSAKSAGTISRQRGLTVAVLKSEGKDLLVEGGPLTPGLGSAPLRSGRLDSTGLRSAGLSAPSTGVPQSARRVSFAEGDHSGDGKRKEIILCRYYHTPGLTCTSRPCRFVHNLDTLQLQTPNFSKDISSYKMLSPTLPSPSPGSILGTFAQAQLKAMVPKQSINDIDVLDVVPGETVVVAAEDGEEVVGQVYVMSGGGKGPAGKSKAKYKTVPCKDFAEGHCPYGEYCSFIHAEFVALPLPPPTESQIQSETERIVTEDSTTRASQSHQHQSATNLSAWTRTIPQAILMPSLQWDKNVIDKTRAGLSAFAPPFLQNPVTVADDGQLIGFAGSELISPKTIPQTERLQQSSPTSAPSAVAKKEDEIEKPGLKVSKPPKVSAWVRPIALKLTPVKVEDHEPTPLYSATSCVIPISAFSFNTDSDLASPLDQPIQTPAIQQPPYVSPILEEPSSYINCIDHVEEGYQQGYAYNPISYPVSAPTYPWGMPMSPLPVPGYPIDPSIASIPGGPGVLWTPAGWAVQDAAMKNALKAAENKFKGSGPKQRKPRSYYKTRPCRFFAEGHCPHGDNCTYLHIAPESASISGSDSEQLKTPNEVPLKLHPNARTQPCKFFNSSTGCLNGTSCQFLHHLVVPTTMPLVDKPRPWRTRPCRHYQTDTCTLGDACHFAHVYDGEQVKGEEKSHKPCVSWGKSGRCEFGEKCRFVHVGEGGEENSHNLTEERLHAAFEEIRSKCKKVIDEDEDDEDDDVEIVTQDTSTTASPLRSALGHNKHILV